MEKGIAFSKDLFDKGKVNIFFYEEEIGNYTEVPTGCRITTGKNKYIDLPNQEQVVTYLMGIRNKRMTTVRIAQPAGPQLGLFT